MKANELMIGDWVKYGNRFAIVREISYYCIILVSVNKNDEWVKETYDNINPILITKEILKRNGFEESEEDEFNTYIIDKIGTEENYEIIIDWRDSYDNGAADAFNVVKWGECWRIHILKNNSLYENEAGFLYVHQLQHALRLCGIIKNIEI